MNIIDLSVRVHAATERAILVSETGEERKAAWLPLSQIEVLHKPQGRADISLPEWLATKKGLV